MAEQKIMKLRSIADLSDAHEWLFNRQVGNHIDSKAADAINTTLKGAVYLNAKLKLDAAKLIIQAQIKKVQLPEGMLPDLR